MILKNAEAIIHNGIGVCYTVDSFYEVELMLEKMCA